MIMLDYDSEEERIISEIQKTYNKLCALCLIFGSILGIIIGATIHHWWYHSF